MRIRIKYQGKITISKEDDFLDSKLRKAIYKTIDKNANLSLWIDDAFQDMGLKGGSIELELTKNNQVYTIVTYKSLKKLAKKQLDKLIKETTEQLIDGYGEECWIIERENKKIEIELVDIFAKKNPVSYLMEEVLTEKKDKRKSPLFLLIEKGEISKVDKYLTQEHLFSKDKWGLTPLFYAIQKNQTELAIKMIELGAAINHTKGFSSPLTTAITANNVLMSEILIKRGAEVNFNDPDPDLNQSRPPLFIAVQNNNIILVELLLKNGANINLQCVNGQTVLHNSNTFEMTKYLLEKDANPHVKDVWNKNTLDEMKFQLKGVKDFWSESIERDTMVNNYTKIIEFLERK